MTRTIAVFISALLFHFYTQAQGVLSVDEAIASALQHNYDIQILRNDSASFALDYKYVNAAFLPQLNATAGKVWNKNNQQQNFLDGRKRKADVGSNNISSAVNLNWTLFDGLKMFVTKQRLAEMQKLGELGVRNQVVNTIAAVINNYYNISAQKQQLRAIEEQISINEERVKLADKKLSVGLGSKPELLQAKVDLNAQLAAKLKQQTLIEQLTGQLNQLIGQPLETKYDVNDSIPINMNIDFASISNAVADSNPALQVAKKNIDIAKLELKERKAERWPTISFNSAYNFNRTTNATVVNPEFQAIYSLNKGFNYGFSASIPILNGFNTRRMIQQAQLTIENQQLVYGNQLSQISLGLNNAYKDYQYQQNALRLEEENIALAKENVFIALARFRQGVSTYIELREAQISLAEAYNRLIAARYNTKLAETELLRLKGDLLRGN